VPGHFVSDTPTALAELVSVEGVRTWAGVSLEHSELERQLRAWLDVGRLKAGDPFDPAELYIASACASGVDQAIAAFEKRYIASAWGAVRSYRISSDDREELSQRIRLRLFVARRDGVPVVLHCAGRGRIGGLVRVMVVRETQRLRGVKRELALAPDHLDPQRRADEAHGSQEHQALLKTAFEYSVPQLDVRARSVLRLHYVRGINGSQIGKMYGVHRATAMRWLGNARAALLDGVREQLVRSAPELADWDPPRLQELVHSQLELSLSRLFADSRSPSNTEGEEL